MSAAAGSDPDLSQESGSLGSLLCHPLWLQEPGLPPRAPIRRKLDCKWSQDLNLASDGRCGNLKWRPNWAPNAPRYMFVFVGVCCLLFPAYSDQIFRILSFDVIQNL